MRLKIRAILHWFLIDMGIAAKVKDCNNVNANHSYYNIYGTVNGCYYCKQVFPRDSKMTKIDSYQQILGYIDNYLEGEKTVIYILFFYNIQLQILKQQLFLFCTVFLQP